MDPGFYSRGWLPCGERLGPARGSAFWGAFTQQIYSLRLLEVSMASVTRCLLVAVARVFSVTYARASRGHTTGLYPWGLDHVD